MIGEEDRSEEEIKGPAVKRQKTTSFFSKRVNVAHLGVEEDEDDSEEDKLDVLCSKLSEEGEESKNNYKHSQSNEHIL